MTVRFPLLTVPAGATPLLDGADLLVWTTTPWTLVSNTAVAVHPDESYVVARQAGGPDAVVVAEQTDVPGARRRLARRGQAARV